MARQRRLTSLALLSRVIALAAGLRANDQILGGAKGELVERCVDRKVYGNLPRCPRCAIGKLKVSYPRALGHGGMGTFTCPGGYDDDQYVRCGFRETSADRPEWTVTQWEDAAASKPAKSAGGGKSAGKAPAPPKAMSAAARSAAAIQVAMPGEDD